MQKTNQLIQAWKQRFKNNPFAIPGDITIPAEKFNAMVEEIEALQGRESYVVFVEEYGTHDRIKYVGTSKDRAVNVFRSHPDNAINQDCWIEVWQGEVCVSERWIPDER